MLDETLFSSMHDFIIRDDRSKFTSMDGSVVIKLRVLSGELAQARREHPTIFKGHIASPLGFSDVIDPGALSGNLLSASDIRDTRCSSAHFAALMLPCSSIS